MKAKFEKKIIGFDFDNVLLSYPPLVPKELIDYLYKRSFSSENKKNFSLMYRFPGKLEQKIRIFSHSPIFRHLIKKNTETLSSISSKNYDIYLISSRFSFLENRTEEVLKKYKLIKYFTKTFFNFENMQPHIFKDEVIKKLNIEMFVDDDLDLLNYLAPRNPNVEFFWISNKKNKKALPKNISHIYDLKEFKQTYLK